jgi:hypothetical protein
VLLTLLRIKYQQQQQLLFYFQSPLLQNFRNQIFVRTFLDIVKLLRNNHLQNQNLRGFQQQARYQLERTLFVIEIMIVVKSNQKQKTYLHLPFSLNVL